MKRAFFLITLLLVTQTYGFSQSPAVFTVMFYNVENLFDTRNDSTRNDDDFLPTAKKRWTYERYNTKTSNIYKTIAACGRGHAPDLVGMCEVENLSCIKSLVYGTPLSQVEYRFVHYDSPDPRGIDVALLYNPKTFRVLSSRPVPITAQGKRVRTRDILMVKGIILPADTLFVFVNHWSSRLGGAEKSEGKRTNIASQLRWIIDSIASRNKNIKLVAMGDFNDTPDNKSISENLGARSCSQPGGIICNSSCWYSFPGTYKYRGDWDVFDQIIVSRALLATFKNSRSRVCDEPFLLAIDKAYGGQKPLKTYDGMKYVGGFSDHLPVILELHK